MVVGGSQVAIPPDDSAIGRGIARALNNRWGMGLSRYRRDAASGAADTVYLGAFRTADLRRVGGWNTDFATNQDFELNRRLGREGTVWFEADLPVSYVPRQSLRRLYAQYRRFGSWKVRYWRRVHDRPRPRQLVFLVGVPAAAIASGATLVALHGSDRLIASTALAAMGVLFELAGSRGPRGGATVHGWSALASGAVAAGWLTGAWSELLWHRARVVAPPARVRP